MNNQSPNHTSRLLMDIRQDVQSLVQVIPAFMLVLDSFGVILTANETVANLLNKKPEDMPGTTIYEAWPENADLLRERITQVVNLQIPDSFQAAQGNRVVNMYLYPAGDGKQITSILIFGQDITDRLKYEKQVQDLTDQLELKVRERTEKLRGLSEKLVNIQESQFKYLAQELHDQVGQNMTAININLNILKKHIEPAGSPQLVSRLNDTITLLAESVDRMRNLMAEFRPPVLDNYGLTSALYWHAEQLSNRANISIIVDDQSVSENRLPVEIEIGLFRIAQEALNNVIKHARATQAMVELQQTADTFEMIITDDGIGIQESSNITDGAEPHWGLDIMRERAESLGGRFSLESVAEGGAQLRVSIPKKSSS